MFRMESARLLPIATLKEELEPLARIVDPIKLTTLAGYRGRALLLLGFAAALRRSELVALDVEDLAFDPARGLKLRGAVEAVSNSRSIMVLM
jgi:integrase